jgi:CheY-like chemotaxis protein
MRDMAVEHDYYAEARVRLAEAHDGADRVARIVRQMRALSRPRTSKPSRVDVRAVIENVLSIIGNELRYRGQLFTRYEPAPRVLASENDLEQAFLGLLLRVARFRVEESASGREIRLSVSRAESGGVAVVVTDDGAPMDAESRAQLFDPFSSGSLAICQSILGSLDARLDVIDSPSGGTTFTVVLPEAPDDGVEESVRFHSSQPSQPPPTPIARAKVLVIDDDPGVARTLHTMLESVHEVKSVESAREGLRLLLGEERFDIVLCDLVMPELSGMDLYRSLELNRPEVLSRIVFMTGGVFTADAERFLAAVRNPRIEKPFSLARIEQLLAQAVDRRSGAART